MKRRIISLILILIIAFGAVPLSTVFAVDTTSVVVTADKTSAYPGDTVLFTVSVGAVNHLMGAEFVLSIPSGMTYTLNSAAVAEGLAGKVGFVSADWTESTMKFTAYGDGDYSSADLTDFLTFSCKIDDNTLGEITPQITDVVLSDTNFEEISTSVNTDGAVVTVSAAPVSATGVTLNKNTLSLYTGDSETLIANLIPANSANKTVSWKSDDTSVATVDDNGKVTAIKKGSTTVTVTTADGGFTDTCTVDVACSHSNKTVHPAVASTCLVGGNGEYTTCDDCGEVISGSSAQLPLGDHNYIENVQSKYLLSAAQCNKKAVYYKSCSVCGVASTTDTFEYGEVDPNNHKNTKVINAKAATCCENGYTGDTYCNDCNTIISSGTVILASGKHTDADGKWETDGTNHWHTCYYGTQFDIATHTGGAATCTEKAKCSVCGAEYGNFADHALTHHDAVAPDYENDGNIEYWICDDCGKYFSDSEGNNEITADDIIIAKLTVAEYQFLDGEVIIEAPDGAIPEGSFFDVQKIVPPPTEVVEKVKEQMGSSSEVLAYYEIRLSNTDGELIIHLDGEITIKIQMPEKYVGSKCVKILQEDETGKLIVMESWWEGEYLCYKTDWLEIYN